MSRTPEEKRRARRVKHDSVLEIYDSQGKLVDAVLRLVDLSTDGACFTSTQALPRGARIQARLRLLGEGVLYVTGRIVWTKTKGNATRYGLKFNAVGKAGLR
mgnify:FL=1